MRLISFTHRNLFLLIVGFSTVTFATEDNDLHKTITEAVEIAQVQDKERTAFVNKLQAGQISEEQRIADLKARVERFQLKLGQYESKWHDQVNEAKYIAVLARTGDEFIVGPLLKELLDTERDKPNSVNMPRYMHYTTAASIGVALAKTKSESLNAKTLVDKYNIARVNPLNTSLQVGLTYLLAGIDTEETLKPLYEVIAGELDGDQTAVKALKNSKSTRTIDVLIDHGISHSTNALTRGMAIESIQQICELNIDNKVILAKCIRTVFPTFLSFIKGLDNLSDVDVIGGGLANTVAQQAYLSFVSICKADEQSAALIQACTVLVSLRGEKRIQAQYTLVNLPQILEEYVHSLEAVESTLDDYVKTLGSVADSYENLINIYGEFADSLLEAANERPH